MDDKEYWNVWLEGYDVGIKSGLILWTVIMAVVFITGMIVGDAI